MTTKIEVAITNECHQLVQANAILPFKPEGVQLPNGDWKIPLEQETVDRVLQLQLKGETFSDTIFRVLSTKLGKN